MFGPSTPRSEGSVRSGLSGSGISGSSNWQLRWTGPPGSQAASKASGSGAVRSAKLAASPNSRTWSVVWLAPVPRRRAGRSAVRATRGTPAWAASRTAGCRLAAAVPDVVTTAAGRRDARANPSATKAAVRSSIRVCRVIRSSAASANESGALREPGQSTTSVSPRSTSRSTSQVARRVDGVTSDDPAARPRPRPSGVASAPPAPARPPPPPTGRDQPRGVVRAGRRRRAAAGRPPRRH